MTNTSTIPSTQTPTTAGRPPADGESGAKAAVSRVADEAPAQAARVVDDAKTQLRTATRRAMGDLRTQADERAVQAAQGLRSFSTRADALAAGNTEAAGDLTGFVQSLGRQAQDFANRLDGGGVDGVVDELARFGRRRPLAFLGLSLGAGFVVGRLVRTTAAVVSDDQSDAHSPMIMPMNDDPVGTLEAPFDPVGTPYEVGQ
jgi:hypothetical protein